MEGTESSTTASFIDVITSTRRAAVAALGEALEPALSRSRHLV
jgi:hypothetical protein